jgi:hypothetical protein
VYYSITAFSTQVGETEGTVPLSDFWLEVSIYPEGPANGCSDTGSVGLKQIVRIYPEGPANGCSDTGSVGFSLCSNKCQDGYQVPVFYCMILMEPF